jgi:hypothetical protein
MLCHFCTRQMSIWKPVPPLRRFEHILHVHAHSPKGHVTQTLLYYHAQALLFAQILFSCARVKKNCRVAMFLADYVPTDGQRNAINFTTVGHGSSEYAYTVSRFEAKDKECTTQL